MRRHAVPYATPHGRHLGAAGAVSLTAVQRRVIVGTVAGTALEWYDFYLFVALAPIVGALFFAPLEPTTRAVFALLAFVAGFAVRPIGALLFGGLADRVGRKTVFVGTVALMGGSTFAMGLLPGWDSWGLAAPIALVALRLVQGLAIGGEYRAAAAFMAEHAPPGARARFTGWLQTTATLGLLGAIVAQLSLLGVLGERGFAEWGWRVPFMMSVLLLPLALWVRLRLPESPVFGRLRDAGGLARAPLRQSLGSRRRLGLAMLALFGLTAGQAVLWYTGHVHALHFLQTVAAVRPADASAMLAVALLLALPAFVAFGALADRIGRRWPVVIGCLLAASLYVPIFGALQEAAHPALGEAQRRAPIVLMADPATCRMQFDPLGIERPRSDCDVVRRHLAARGIGYERLATLPDTTVRVAIGAQAVSAAEVAPGDAAALRRRMDDALQREGYPLRAEPDRIDRVRVVALLWVLVVLAAMVYAPVAAVLSELFPTRIRCSAMALPYHVGNGWFGGFLPAIAAASVAARGEALAGIGFPIAVAMLTGIVALVALPETRERDLERVR